MNIFAIMVRSFTNASWKMNWNPTQDISASDSDVLDAVHYIKNGVWASNASPVAKKCYEALAEQIADKIVENDFSTDFHTQMLMMLIRHYHDERKFSPKGNLLFDRLTGTSDFDTMKKLCKKIVKAENLFLLQIDETRSWTDEELSLFECCICGTRISDELGHNPYPVRSESWYGERENRCCPICNYQIVVPARLRFGRSEENHRKLAKLNHDELIGIFA